MFILFSNMCTKYTYTTCWEKIVCVFWNLNLFFSLQHPVWSHLPQLYRTPLLAFLGAPMILTATRWCSTADYKWKKSSLTNICKIWFYTINSKATINVLDFFFKKNAKTNRLRSIPIAKFNGDFKRINLMSMYKYRASLGSPCLK